LTMFFICKTTSPMHTSSRLMVNYQFDQMVMIRSKAHP
jgi:hypothetical protein